ncbi:MAG: HNH endonuclease [Methylocystis sp.]
MKLTRVAAAIAAADAQFEAHAVAKTLYAVVRVPKISGVVSADEMKALYKTQMSSANGQGRAYYDALRNSAPNKKCPLCGVGVVSTLDHHLPQSKYPDLTVSPLNLVPCCADCNKAKLAKFPKTPGEQTIHPYFDDFTHAQWVHAGIHQGPPLTVSFQASAPIGWNTVDAQRVVHHFAVYKLASLYGANANDELVVIKPVLARLFATGSSVALRGHLLEQASIHSGRLNSWQHALYRDLANDAWFCGGGFMAIPESQ